MIKRTIGLFIITVGLLVLLSNLEIVNFDNISGLVFSLGAIFIGVVGLFERKRFDFVLTVLIAVGLICFLNNLDFIDNDTVNLIVGPIIIVSIGLAFLFSFNRGTTSMKSVTNYVALFSGVEDKNESKDYVSSEITAIFGGAEVNYRKIKMANDVAYINVTAIFGGATLIIPENVKVTVKGLPIFGGADNKAISDPDSKKEIVINYTAVFGGVEIKN